VDEKLEQMLSLEQMLHQLTTVYTRYIPQSQLLLPHDRMIAQAK
jgi:hypothetical protein